MSYSDYVTAHYLRMQGHSLSSLLMAAMHQAESEDIKTLSSAYPEVWAELGERLASQGGRVSQCCHSRVKVKPVGKDKDAESITICEKCSEECATL